MRKVKFLMDYQGKLVNDKGFYATGTVAEFEEATAKALVDAKRAEYVEEARAAYEWNQGAKPKSAPAPEKAPAPKSGVNTVMGTGQKEGKNG